VPNYKVSLAEKIIPAADLSEQISAANRESSGTSNIKYAINGAVTIASRNGANLEMSDRIGQDAIFFFGHSDNELDKIENYKPYEILESNPDLNAVFSFLEEKLPSFPEGSMINPLLASLRDMDPYFVLYEFDDYVHKQKSIDELYKDRFTWLSRCLKSIARSSWFSGDRAVHEYSKEIWNLE